MAGKVRLFKRNNWWHWWCPCCMGGDWSDWYDNARRDAVRHIAAQHAA